MALERIEVGLVERRPCSRGLLRHRIRDGGTPGARVRSWGLVAASGTRRGDQGDGPRTTPTLTEPTEPFIGAIGLRYLTMFVGDLDGVLERAATRGGKLQHGPLQTGPGTRVAVLQDPGGNAVEVVEAS
jgi:hypothetical protein